MARDRLGRLCFIVGLLILLIPGWCWAQEGPTASEAGRSANNAWMMTSSALVLFMTAPGLAMFYSGLVRRKNVLGVMMQCLFLMALMTVIWGLWGYSLAFGAKGQNPFIGNGEFLFLKQVKMVDGAAPGESLPDLTFMVFQGMFFIITPALICGAFAERMKFSSMVLLMIAWGTLVYCPLCHWDSLNMSSTLSPASLLKPSWSLVSGPWEADVFWACSKMAASCLTAFSA